MQFGAPGPHGAERRRANHGSVSLQRLPSVLRQIIQSMGDCGLGSAMKSGPEWVHTDLGYVRGARIRGFLTDVLRIAEE
jgi:hypothetical protein